MESALTLTLQQKELLAIVHQPDEALDIAVLLVVGGPQYRVGSHRQFVQLSRHLADNKIPSMRFDYTGMGDSQGDKKEFDSICDDISVAVDALVEQTGKSKVVIWGLCDAASAAMIYAHKDQRICGLVLLNPWLRDDQAMGKTMLKYYYVQRLLSRDFWKKLFGGKVNITGSISDAKGFAQDSVKSSDTSQESYQQRMLSGTKAFSGPICLILSGVDLTAKEFEEQAFGTKPWRFFSKTNLEIHKLEKADHTFSSRSFKQQVEEVSSEFVKKLIA